VKNSSVTGVTFRPGTRLTLLAEVVSVTIVMEAG